MLEPFANEQGRDRVLPVEQLRTGIGKREYRPRHRNMTRKTELKGIQGVIETSRGKKRVMIGNPIIKKCDRTRCKRVESEICIHS